MECGCLKICHTIIRILDKVSAKDGQSLKDIEEEKHLLEEQKEEYYQHLEDKFEGLKTQDNDQFIFHNKIKELIQTHTFTDLFKN